MTPATRRGVVRHTYELDALGTAQGRDRLRHSGSIAYAVPGHVVTQLLPAM